VQLRCASVCEVDLADAAYSYDLAIASDLIEHLSPAELELLYRRLSHWLKPDGLFIVHTFPNLWYYRYHYAARRRRADKLGAWLPLEPRSRYERLMHINEQSPRVLQRQLAQAFRHVHLWFADVTQPGGSLLRPYTIRELAAAPSLYAVASQSALAMSEISGLLQMLPLSEQTAAGIGCRVLQAPDVVTPAQRFEVEVQLSYPDGIMLNSYFPCPVHLCYHWLSADGNHMLVFDGERTKMLPETGQSSVVSPAVRPQSFARIVAPSASGQYRLRVTLVQEGVRWFDQLGVFDDVKIQVSEQ
jgi:hypothetical protein